MGIDMGKRWPCKISSAMGTVGAPACKANNYTNLT
jgi:hypothetical protein